MNRGDRDNRDTRNRSPERGHNSENNYPKRQGRQPEDDWKREEVDEEEEESRRSPTEDEDDVARKTRKMDERSKDRRGQTRDRWKDAGVDQVKVEKRKARQERMVKVMKLFEDTVLIDKISLKDRKGHMEDIRTRLEVIKREHNQKIKQNITSHWTNLTKQGSNSRASTQPEEKPETVHRKDTGNRDHREKDGTRLRPANSGQTHDRNRDRETSSDTSKKDSKGENSPEVEAGRQGAGSAGDRQTCPIYLNTYPSFVDTFVQSL